MAKQRKKPRAQSNPSALPPRTKNISLTNPRAKKPSAVSAAQGATRPSKRSSQRSSRPTPATSARKDTRSSKKVAGISLPKAKQSFKKAFASHAPQASRPSRRTSTRQERRHTSAKEIGRISKETWRKISSRTLPRPLIIGAACLLGAAILGTSISLAQCGSTGFNASVQNNASGFSTSAATDDDTNNASTKNRTEEKLQAMGRAISALSEGVANIQNERYQVGFCTQPCQGGIALSYHADRSFYAASAIKGPYVLATIERIGSVPTSQKENIEEAIVNSDNDAYWHVKRALGTEAINAELASVGATEKLGIMGSYVHLTPAQLSGLYQISYSYTTSSTPATTWLKTIFSRPTRSLIADLEGAHTWSKPGWIASSEESATVDAGIVTTANDTYSIAVMTNKGEDFEAVAPLVENLNLLEVLCP